MELLLVFGGGFLLGAVVSAVAVNALGQSKQSAGEVEKAQLQERLNASIQENQRLNTALDTGLNKTAELESTVGDLRQQLGAVTAQAEAQAQQLEGWQAEKLSFADERERLVQARQTLSNQLAETRTTLDAERAKTSEKLAMLKAAKEELSNQFSSLAGAILDEKTKKFTEQNQQNMSALLGPLKTQLTDFKAKVEDVYEKENAGRSALMQQVESLHKLNNQLSADAHNLTNALKGQVKTQGNWGEMILEKVLEASGLQKGREYEVQASFTREDGSRAQPDVLIHLPEKRYLIVDAKVSLTAYEQYTHAETDAERELAIRAHVQSVRKHIEGLSGKNYQQREGALDCVVMFMPIEPAYMLAIAQDSKLWSLAWDKNVLLVSPSTFLFVVRTVAHLWRQEQQSQNAQEIAKRGGELYDKFAGFVSDLEAVGESLKRAQRAYDGAHNKLSSGKGNVIRQAEMLKELGVKPNKQLPQLLLDETDASEDGGSATD